MWIDHFNAGTLTLDMELSTFCNAKCPQCSRTDEKNNLNKHSWLNETSVTIDQFKEWLKPDDFDGLKNIHFSGSYGDPGMCKDLLKIVDYIINHASFFTNVSINTNGSMRDEDFWFKLSCIGGKRLRLLFDVDGINQEMHSHYRRNTNLEKTLNNMESAAAGPANVEVLTVLFKHNQDYIQEIKNMCLKRGAQKFETVDGNNFKENGVFKFFDTNGNQKQLDQITRPEVANHPNVNKRRIRDHRHTIGNVKTKEDFYNIKSWPWDKIECMTANDGNLKVAVNGSIMTCCHIGTGYNDVMLYNKMIQPWGTKTGEFANKQRNPHPVIQKKFNRYDKFKLGSRPLREILEDDWWNKDLKESWNSKEPIFGCVKTCGKKHGIDVHSKLPKI